MKRVFVLLILALVLSGCGSGHESVCLKEHWQLNTLWTYNVITKRIQPTTYWTEVCDEWSK